MDSFKDNFYFQKTTGKSRNQLNLNIVPVLDMMTLIIFFLASTAVFLEFTKQTVPPSATKTITSPERPPPLSPRLMVFNENKQYRLILRWNGATSGQIERFVPKLLGLPNVPDTKDPKEKDKLVNGERETTFKASMEIMDEFFKKFPTERTFQVALSGNTGYQHMISIMDAIHYGVDKLEKQTQKATPEPANIVLVSYSEVDAEYEKNYKDTDK